MSASIPFEVSSTTITPIIVAFDTIFEQCSLAILQGDTVIYEDSVPGARGQTEIILPMLDRALMQTGLATRQVSAWAFNRGPGAFSGIRINTAVVQALSVATNAPCVPVSSLLALVYAACQTEHLEGKCVTAAIDARQREVYVGRFIITDGMPVPIQDEQLLPYDSVLDSDVIVGDGSQLVQTTARIHIQQATAVHIAKLAMPMYLAGQAVEAQHALPVYLRHNAWKTLAEQGKKPTQP